MVQAFCIPVLHSARSWPIYFRLRNRFKVKKLLREYCLIGLFLISQANSVFGVIAQESGSIKTYIASIISGMPGDAGNDYSVPEPWEMATWGRVLNYIIEANYTLASDSAVNIDYRLVEFTDNTEQSNRTYYVLENTQSHYWGTYVYYPAHKRPLVIQSPHPKHDFNTGKQGIHVFHETESAYFFLGGTHRCNHSRKSACDGDTKVCGSANDEPFQISDLAHHDSSLFQIATDTLLQRYSGSYFIQLHGFTKKSSDPYVILSNGTNQTPNPDYLSSFKTHLYNEDNNLTFKIAHIDNWTRLTGFVNAQGRLINGSNDACDVNPNSTNGRFFHVEQEKWELRATEVGWDKVADALANTFGVAPLPVELLGFEAYWKGDEFVQLKWQTASEENNDYFEIMRSASGEHWQAIGRVEGNGSVTSLSSYSYRDYNASTGKTYYQLKQVDLNGDIHFSPIRVAISKTPSSFSVYPNPATSVLVIESRSGFSDVIVSDASGQIYDLNIRQNGNKINLDVSALNRGIYLLKIQDARGAEVRKILIE